MNADSGTVANDGRLTATIAAGDPVGTTYALWRSKVATATTATPAKEAGATPERRAEMELARARAEFLYNEAFGLGRQLAALRNQRRLTQGDLAKATGVGQSEISRIEAGKANPTEETLRKLGAGLGAVLTFATEDGLPVSI